MAQGETEYSEHIKNDHFCSKDAYTRTSMGFCNICNKAYYVI